MIEWNSARPQLEFEVKVGHLSVVVAWHESGRGDHERSRMKLSRDMPRMWDIIHGLESSKFRRDLSKRNELTPIDRLRRDKATFRFFGSLGVQAVYSQQHGSSLVDAGAT